MSAPQSAADTSASYRWIQADHPDLSFYNVPRRFPWPGEEPVAIDAAKDFPFKLLVRAIKRLPMDDKWQWNIWKNLVTILEDSKALNDAIERSQFDEAEKILREMRKLHEHCPFVHDTLGFIARQRGHWDTALGHYQRAVGLAPNLEYIWMRLAECLVELDEERAAIAAYRQAIRLVPGHPAAFAALEKLGEVIPIQIEQEKGKPIRKYLTKDEYHALIADEQKRLAGDIDGLFTLAQGIFESKFSSEEAVAPLQEILAADPNHAPALYYMAEIHRSRRQFDEAAALARRAAGAAPDKAWPHYALAAAAQEQKQREQAIAHLERCLEIDPNLEAALRLRYHADMHLSNGKKEELLAEFGRQKKSWRALLLASEHALGRGEYHLDALKLGMDLAAEAHRLFPAQTEVLIHYTTQLAKHGEHEWIAALARPRLKAGETDPLLRWHYALALRAMKLDELATEELRAALAQGRPEHWGARFDDQLRRWTGLIARSEMELETHGPKKLLRRALFLVREGKPTGLLFHPAIPLGQKHTVRIELPRPRDTARIQIQQGEEAPDLPALNLGVFEITGIDPAQLTAAPVDFHLLLHTDGHLDAAANQGDRRLPLNWSLYPRPALDDEPTASS